MTRSARPSIPCVLMVGITIGLIAVATSLSIDRYRDFRSGWSWDLAYYNQWFWALMHGQTISVRPLGPWTQEGPSVWTMNYLAPIRLAIAPIYAMNPEPRTLLIVQVVFFAMTIPAVFGLVKFETGSSWVALSASALVPLTPLAWPLLMNDFRELQMAPAFVVWSIHGVRARRLGMTALGMAGMLACRQEFAFVVASLAILPPRDPESVVRRDRWARGLLAAGLGWLLFGFLVYERWAVNSYAFEIFLDEMRGKNFPLSLTLPSAAEILLVGLASWTVLAMLSPRSAVLIMPWVLSVAAGRWAMHQIASEQWHHVRYTAPLVGVGIAAGSLGYSRMATWLIPHRHGRTLLLIAWIITAAGLGLADWRMDADMARIPRPISADEAPRLRSWIARVPPDDGVLAHYEVTAPLSSRTHLYSYVMNQNYPRGYPQLPPEICWVFARDGDLAPGSLTDQGFRRVHDGPHIRIYHRENRAETREPIPSTPVRIATSPNAPTDSIYLAIGNAVIVATNVFWTALLLAPGAVVIKVARRRIAAIRHHPDGSTGDEIVAALCRSEGLEPPPVEITREPFAPWYDPVCKTIRLRDDVSTIASRAAAARETSAFVMHARGDWLIRAREPIVFAMRLGVLAGILLMTSGLAMASWLPVHLGAGLLSLSVVMPWAMLWPLERRTSRRAEAFFRRDRPEFAVPEAEVRRVLAALEMEPVGSVLNVVPRNLRARNMDREAGG